MTDYEIEDIARLMIPYRNGKLRSVGPMKVIEWRWSVNGNRRSHSVTIATGDALNASEFRSELESEIEIIRNKYPDEEF